MKLTKLTIIFGLVLLLLGNVSSFAISSQYWEENPLIMQPGEEREIPLVLQNLAGDEVISSTLSITDGSQIAQIDKTEYTIQAGSKEEVILKVKIPKKSEDKYLIVVSVSSKSEGTETLNIKSSVEREIPVIVKEVPKKVSGLTYWIIGGLLLVIILLLVLLLKKKSKKRK